jgi:hypothetical protein
LDALSCCYVKCTGNVEILKTTRHFCGKTKHPIHGCCVAEGEENRGHSTALCISCRFSENNNKHHALEKWLDGFDERYDIVSVENNVGGYSVASTLIRFQENLRSCTELHNAAGSTKEMIEYTDMWMTVSILLVHYF